MAKKKKSAPAKKAVKKAPKKAAKKAPGKTAKKAAKKKIAGGPRKRVIRKVKMFARGVLPMEDELIPVCRWDTEELCRRNGQLVCVPIGTCFPSSGE